MLIQNRDYTGLVKAENRDPFRIKPSEEIKWMLNKQEMEFICVQFRLVVGRIAGFSNHCSLLNGSFDIFYLNFVYFSN